MSYVKRDLIVHFDEANGQYSFYAVDASATEVLRANAGGKLAADASFFGTAGSSEAEHAIGRLVLTLLDRSYQAAPLASAEPAVPAPAAKPVAGAEEFRRFVDLQSRAMKEYSAELLGQAEDMLRAAANLGNDEAAEAIKDWPTVKMVSQKLIARGPQ